MDPCLPLTCVLLLPFCAAGFAGEEIARREPPRAEAAFVDHPVVVDGILETVWGGAKPIPFPVPDAQPGSNASPVSEVRFLWTERGVFVGFQAVDATPAYGSAGEAQPLHEEDVFELFVDQMGDHKQYFEIQIDPAGRAFFKNYVLTAPPRLTPERRLTQEFAESELWRYELPRPDDLQVASRFDSATGRWSAEIFLPAAFINRRRGGTPLEPCEWRINLVRHDWDLPKGKAARTSEFLYWAPVTPGCPHLSPEAMGYLELKSK